MYEAPILMDIEDLAGADGCGVCITGGGAVVEREEDLTDPLKPIVDRKGMEITVRFPTRSEEHQ